MTAVSDNFDRGNSSNLGASWTEVVGDWEIVSNRCQNNTDDGATGYYARYETDVGSSDMFSQAVTTSSQADGSSNTGLAVRMRSGANTSYQLTTRHAGDTIGVWRVVAGSESQQSWQTGAQSISTTINSGDTIRVEVVGSLIRGKVAGALVGLCVDTNITDGQRAGLNGYNNIGTDVVEVDDFAGGGLAADGGLLAPYIVGISAQVTGTGTTLTPTVPSNVATGDLVVAHCTSRDAAQTMTAPGSEGWDAGPAPSQTGLEDAVFYKVWGAGATDDTTPTFSIGSGAAGWGVTVTVFRNPSHGSAPWTSTSVAVVASGSAANASSATVTAPSVNHDGTHRTVVRLFSSADDNALNDPSTGALAYGGAAYDQTTGNDYAQAMSLREDITVTTNTGTSTVTETAVGNDINNGITLVLAVPSGSAVTGTAVLAGTGSLTASGTRGVTGTATLVGTGSLTAAGVRATTGQAPLGGTGTLTAAGIRGRLGTAALTGTGTLTAEGDRAVTGTASLSGGTLAATGVRSTTGQGSLSGGSLTASGTTGRSGTAALAGTSTLAAAATRGVTGVAVAAATGSFTASGEASSPGEGLGSLVGVGSLSAAGVRGVAAVASLQAVGSFAGTGIKIVTGVGSLAAVGSVAASGVVEGVVTGTGALVAAGFLSATGRRSVIGSAALAGSGVLVAAGSVGSQADPNPTIVRIRESRASGLSDPLIPRLREPA